MKEITIDYALRASWQAVARMYNEEAKNFDHLNNVNKIYSSGVWQSVEHQQSIFDQVIKNSNFFISTEEIR